MRIEHVHIYGFGHLTNVKLQFAANGIHVLYGPNEAGKTTLLAFIRAILFGFDSSKIKKRYEPVDNGKYGGKITFQTTDFHQGPITIERTFSNRALRGNVHIFDCDGRELAEDTCIEEPFKQLSAQVYQSIYAFGLDELEDFQSLSNQEIQSRIHSAGMGLGNISPVEIEKKLEAKKLSLYRKRGQDQPLTKLLRKQQELRNTVQQLSKIPEQYTQLQQSMAELKGKIDQLKQTKCNLENEYDQASTFAHLRELWEEIAPLETVLNQLPKLPVCSRETFYEWEQLQREQQALEERFQTYSEQITSCNLQVNSIQTDDIWAQQWDEIVRLHDTRHVFTEWENRCQQLGLEIQQVEARLQNLLGQLDKTDGESEWRKIPTTFVIYEEIRMFGQSRQALVEQIPLQQAQLEQLQKQFELAVDECTDVNGRLAMILDTCEWNGVSLEPFQQALKNMQALFSELQQLTYRRTSVEERIEQLQQDLDFIQQNRLRQKQKSQPQLKKGYFITGVLLILAILTICGILWPAWQTVMIVIGFTTLVFTSIFLIFIRQLPNKNTEAPIATEVERLQQVVEQTQIALTTIDDTIQAKTMQMNTIAKPFDLNVTGLTLQQLQHNLDQFTQRIFRQKMIRERIAELRAHQKDCERKREKLRLHVQEANDKLKKFEQQQEDWQSSWQVCLHKYDLPATLAPDSARQYLQLVERVKECFDLQQNLERDLRRYHLDMEQFIREVHAIQKKLSHVPADQREILIALQGLYEQAKQNRIKREQQAGLQKSLEQLQREQKQTEKTLQIHLQAVEDWLKSYGFYNFQQVPECFESTQKKQQLSDELNMLYLKLEAIIGSRALLDRYLPQIRSKDVAAWNRIVQDAEQELTSIQTELDECRLQQGKLENEINRLETSTELSQLHQHIQLLDTEIKDFVEEWSIYTIAQKLLELARQKYERERQPAVLQKASDMFRLITEERYAYIRSPIEQPEIRVITSHQSALSTFALSRGTAEQLYLTMRFALIGELLEKGVHAPVIMDDVFVNFDPARLQATIQVIENLAKDHQILFLTCHPHIVQSLQLNIQDCQIIEFFYGRQDFTLQQEIQ